VSVWISLHVIHMFTLPRFTIYTFDLIKYLPKQLTCAYL
jgi:hypothetical protein